MRWSWVEFFEVKVQNRICHVRRTVPLRAVTTDTQPSCIQPIGSVYVGRGGTAGVCVSYFLVAVLYDAKHGRLRTSWEERHPNNIMCGWRSLSTVSLEDNWQSEVYMGYQVCDENIQVNRMEATLVSLEGECGYNVDLWFQGQAPGSVILLALHTAHRPRSLLYYNALLNLHKEEEEEVLG